MKFLKVEYTPTLVLLLAVAQMASYAHAGIFGLSYTVASFFSFVSLGSGLGIYWFLRKRDVTAARIAAATGVLFFILLFAAGEFIFASYYP